jgi:coenzyme F420-reducing hydrogenase delta subunit/NAD-dependent dihydropyrimidine dehydrogenase PreA subunit
LSTFEPVIVAFACNECCYAAADLAGVSHFQYPPNILIVRVPCSGRVDLTHILRAFENGADGVMIGGCLQDQCHYVDGNIKARTRIDFLKSLLEKMGMRPERVRMEFISAAMGDRFAVVAKEMTEEIRGLGPAGVGRLDKVPPEKKREYIRAVFRKVLSDSGKRPGNLGEIEVAEEGTGFGLVTVDTEKCLACGACDFVCRDDAMKFTIEGDRFKLSHSHWRCHNCKSCRDVCPGECITIRPVLDLDRFIQVDRETVLETGAARCSRCGEIFAPESLVANLDKIGKGSKIPVPTCCVRCKRFAEAEKRATAMGLGDQVQAN